MKEQMVIERKTILTVAGVLVVLAVAVGITFAMRGSSGYPTAGCTASWDTAKSVVVSDHGEHLDDLSIGTVASTLSDCKTYVDWRAGLLKMNPNFDGSIGEMIIGLCQRYPNTRVCIDL